LELAERIRALTRQGYALADLVMLAYQHHRDELVSRREARTTRHLHRRRIGRSPFTVTLSTAERDALDALARHLDTTPAAKRSQRLSTTTSSRSSRQTRPPNPARRSQSRSDP
jgi:hypothetical protein